MNRQERTATLLLCAGIVLAASWLCYDNLLFAIGLLPYCALFYGKQTRRKGDSRKWQLNLQFGDALKGLSAALEAGYSVENGIAEAYRDLLSEYREDDLIMTELRVILNNIRNGMSVEEAFLGFAKRSGIEDAEGFADVFATAQRTGGNIIGIIRSTTEMIRTRIDISREVRTVTASARYESDIMKAVPFGVLLYLRLLASDMVAALYGNIKGILFMTAVLVIYVILCEVSDRMVRIEL